MSKSKALQQLDTLATALQELVRADLTAAAFSAIAEKQVTLLATLPPRYAEVLAGLLTRLESSALFTEESCSFSHQDLLGSMQMWCDKARVWLADSVTDSQMGPL